MLPAYSSHIRPGTLRFTRQIKAQEFVSWITQTSIDANTRPARTRLVAIRQYWVGDGRLRRCSSAAGAEGGLSGVPLQPASTAAIRHIRKHIGNQLAIIGAGGIGCAASALEKLRAGANLLQVYTGLVYRAPGLLHANNRGLVQMLAQRGARSLAELAAGRFRAPRTHIAFGCVSLPSGTIVSQSYSAKEA